MKWKWCALLEMVCFYQMWVVVENNQTDGWSFGVVGQLQNVRQCEARPVCEEQEHGAVLALVERLPSWWLELQVFLIQLESKTWYNEKVRRYDVS
jgi:hypothetical protein